MAVGGEGGAPSGAPVKQRFDRQKSGFTQVLVTFQKVRWVQEVKELTLSVIEDVSRRKFDERGPNTPARGAEGTAADLRRLRRAPGRGSLCLRLQFEARL